jgi:hypothetical protein
VKPTTFVLAVSFAALTATAYAQDDGAGPANGPRLRLGPLTLSPMVTLTNIGVDDNVFNRARTDGPQRDFTMTVTPKADWSVRFGRAALTGVLKEDLVYYQRFNSERSVNTSNRVALRVPLNRLTMAVASTVVHKRDRPGFEIDARSRHTQADYDASAELRAFGKTFLALNGRRSTVAFDRDAVFLDSNLRLQLNRRAAIVGLSARHEITPVTSLTLEIERESDRFEFSPLRDSNSTSVAGGVAFKPRTLLSGSASFGYRNFKSLAADVPDFSGMTARVDVAARILGAMKLGLQVERNLQYSHDLNRPYYLLAGGTVSLARGLYGPFDIAGRAGAHSLAYRGRLGVEIPLPDRTDSVRTLGATVGYRLGHGMRLGFNVDKQKRLSEEAQRQYGGVRYGTSVTYAF